MEELFGGTARTVRRVKFDTDSEVLDRARQRGMPRADIFLDAFHRRKELHYIKPPAEHFHLEERARPAQQAILLEAADLERRRNVELALEMPNNRGGTRPHPSH